MVEETTPHPPNRRLVADPPLAQREPSTNRERPGAGKTKICVLGAGHGGSAMAAHPTLSEAVKEAGLVALGRAIHLPPRRRARTGA